ncbi:MAG: glycosyl hydrolase family 28-related protein, partial [Opitutales bacterium]
MPLPNIPAGTFTITDYGAIPDGTTIDTAAIQKTVDACIAAGGGTVIVPAGKFLTGPFTLASNLNLHLAQNATLLITNDIATFPMAKGRYQNCISVANGHDIEISGPGAIDGQGDPWWKAFRANKSTLPHRPNL